MLSPDKVVLQGSEYRIHYQKVLDRYPSIRWGGKDKNGHSVSSGVYLYQMQAGDFVQVKKMSLLR